MPAAWRVFFHKSLIEALSHCYIVQVMHSFAQAFHDALILHDKNGENAFIHWRDCEKYTYPFEFIVNNFFAHFLFNPTKTRFLCYPQPFSSELSTKLSTDFVSNPIIHCQNNRLHNFPKKFYEKNRLISFLSVFNPRHLFTLAHSYF